MVLILVNSKHRARHRKQAIKEYWEVPGVKSIAFNNLFSVKALKCP